MKRFAFAVVSLVALSLGATQALAQHVHTVPHTTTHVDSYQHGNHFHNVPHTTTHYDSVIHNGPDYVPHTTTHIDAVPHNGHIDYRPHTTTHLHPTYPSTYGSSNVIYSTPSFYSVPNGYFSPSIIQGSSGILSSSPPGTFGSTAIQANKIPIQGIGSANSIPQGIASGKTMKLTNPRTTGGDLSYTLNNVRYNIRPGESQTVNMDREWIIKFDNGIGKQIAYRLQDGMYEFSVSPERGWDVGKRVEADALAPSLPSAAPPALPTNIIPGTATSSSTAVPSIAIPSAP